MSYTPAPLPANLRVMELPSPFALAEPELVAQLYRWTPDQSKWLALAREMQEGHVGLWVASSRPDRLEGFFAIIWPKDTLSDLPQILHFQCQGGVKLRRKMVQSVVEIVRQAGYTRFIGTNVAGVPDEVWARTFRDAGRVARKMTLFEFEIGDGENGQGNSGGVRRGTLKKRPNQHSRRHNARSAKGNPRAVRPKPKRAASRRR